MNGVTTRLGRRRLLSHPRERFHHAWPVPVFRAVEQRERRDGSCAARETPRSGERPAVLALRQPTRPESDPYHG